MQSYMTRAFEILAEAGWRWDSDKHEWVNDRAAAGERVDILHGEVGDCDFPSCSVHHICTRKCSRKERNAGPAGERVDAPAEPTDKQLTDRWNELSYYYTPPYSWLEKMRVMLREFAAASPAPAPAEPYRANLQSQGYSVEHCTYPVGDCCLYSRHKAQE